MDQGPQVGVGTVGAEVASNVVSIGCVGVMAQNGSVQYLEVGSCQANALGMEEGLIV